MNIVISKKDIIWSYIGYGIRISSNILLLPIILMKMSSDELGVWYVFLSINALTQLLDLGLSPTIMRNISYAFGGATRLRKEGIEDQQVFQGEPNYNLIYALIRISKSIYLYISIISVLILLTGGSYYVFHITKHLQNSNILFAWWLFSAGVFLNFFYSYWTPILNGVGKIKEAEKAMVISQLIYVIVGAIGIMYSFGLIALAIAFLICGLVNRGISKYYCVKNIPQIKVSTNKKNEELFQIIWHTASKSGLVGVGSWLALQANTLICATFFDLQTTAQFGLTLQFFSIVSAFAGIMFRSYLPMLSEARIKNDQSILKKCLSLTAVIGWLWFITGALIIIFFGNWVLSLMGSKTTLLPQLMVSFMALYLFLEFNHGDIFAAFITTNNEIPFVKAALISGIMIFTISLTLVYLFSIGLWAILISQSLVQLAYNNWKWPKIVLEQLNMNLMQLICLGFFELRILVLKNKNQ